VTASWSIVRVARLIALSIVIGWSIANAIQRINDWSLSDMDAYWNAAIRLREGALLYPPVSDPSAVDIYKYAPWFAWVWVPATFLAKPVVGFLWSLILIGATVAAVLPVIRRRSLSSFAAALFFGSILLWSAASGNVQPLLVAVLVHSLARSSGPVAIGFTASLKVFPLFYALVYLGRREFMRFGLAIGIAAILWLPALLFDLSNYQGGIADSPNPLLAISPALYAVGAIASIAVALTLARTKYRWLAAAAGLFAVLPRVSLIDLSHLVVGIGADTQEIEGSADG
jgi:hypothetical protein